MFESQFCFDMVFCCHFLLKVFKLSNSLSIDSLYSEIQIKFVQRLHPVFLETSKIRQVDLFKSKVTKTK